MIYNTSVMRIPSSSLLLEEVFNGSPVLSYDKHQIIIHADDIPSDIFYLKNGFVKKTALLENGREITLRLYKPGSFFPLVWAFTNIDNFFYTTVTSVELQKAPRDTFVSYIQTHPDALFDLTKQILISEHELFTNIVHALSGDSYHRVVASLVLCAKRFGVKEKKDMRITVPLTHQNIAEITGMTRETVSLAMLKLKKKKIITSSNRAIVIRNIEALEKESTIPTEEPTG